jgi:hypothetical protein
MANQMIALQARNPQLPDPARITAQYANMMNTAAQQRAAQLQGERIRQEMDYARAGEERAQETQRLNVRKEDQAFRVAGMTELRNRGVAVLRSGSEEAYQLWLKQADAIDPDSAAVMRQIAPTFNKDALTFAIMKADEYINKTFPNAEARVEYAGKGGFDAQGRPIPENTPVQVITGIDASTTPIGVAKPTPQPTPRATPTTPQAAEPANPFAPGYQPNSAAANPNSLGLVIDSALETGVMSKSDYDKILSIAEPQIRPKIAAWAQQNNIQIMSDMPGVTDNQMRGEPVADFQTTPMAYDGQTPQSQFAVMRGEPMQSQTAGLRGAPPMEQTLAQYIPVQRKDPNVAPYPGSAQVPLSRLGAEAQVQRESPAEAAAKARATKTVEMEMAPEIAKATKTAERAIELKSEATKAKYNTESLLNDIADRINTIDRLLRNPNRFSIVGPIEGNLPRLMQYGPRADAQAAFDKVKNTATLTSLMDMRKSTQTGASPVGSNPTDKDAKIVEQSASELIQTGEPSKFDANLIDMRRKLYRTFVSAQREHDGVYADVLKDNPRLRLVVPKVSDRYLSSKDMPKPRTSTKVDRNNPLLRGM